MFHRVFVPLLAASAVGWCLSLWMFTESAAADPPQNVRTKGAAPVDAALGTVTNVDGGLALGSSYGYETPSGELFLSPEYLDGVTSVPLPPPTPDELRVLPVDTPMSSLREGAIDRSLPLGNAVQRVSPEQAYMPGSDDSLAVGQSEGTAQRNFGGLTFENQPWRWPRRAGVKLFITHGGSTAQCSGTLIDSIHVLTAAHCLYPVGVGAWPDSIEVVPGYRRLPAGDYVPFGMAGKVDIGYWTGWTDTVDNNIADPTAAIDHNDDMAIIRLDRHIGALAGWYGWGFNDNCSSYTDGTWFNASYPGAGFEDPPGTCVRGTQQYFRRGSFDSCDVGFFGGWNGNQITFNARGWQGQSGSGFYRVDNNNVRFVEAVVSNGGLFCNPNCPVPGCVPGPAITNAVRITGGKFNDIVRWITSATPATPDLIPLNLRIDENCLPTCLPRPPEDPGGPPPPPPCPFFCQRLVIKAGTQLPFVDYKIINYSRVRHNARITESFYLSDDRTIDPADDTLLGSFNFTVNLGPKDRRRYSFTTAAPPSIPLGTAPGIYFVGVILNSPADPNAGNNTTGVQDVAEIRVVGAGACCLPNGTCLAGRTEAECNAAGGVYQGDGTVCVPNPCPQPTGACCIADPQACQQETAAGCAAMGGLFQGLNVPCIPDPCPDVGACCEANGACTMEFQANCAADWRGPGTTCMPNPCPVINGACCDPIDANICSVETEDDCVAMGKMYQGDGTTCAPNPCLALIPTGACCDGADICVVLTEADCLADGGIYAGDGLPCLEDLCGATPIGACCDVNGLGCTLRTAAGCTAIGRDYLGDFVDCDVVACGGVSGACCDAAGACSILFEDDCTRAGGIYQGDGTECSPNPCVPLQSGACCDALDATCSVVPQHICAASGGTYQGDGTTCSPDPCPVIPTGACCDSVGDCAVVTQALCELFGGVYQGDGALCSPDPCTPVTRGACCHPGGGCFVIAPDDCASVGGTYLGDGTDCSGDPCAALPLGACCDFEGLCEELTEANCVVFIAGTWQGPGTTCAADPCPVPPMGACCYAGVGCVFRSQAGCENTGGVYRGDGTLCTGAADCPCGDFDSDFDVDDVDFATFLLAYGTCDPNVGLENPPPSSFLATADGDFDGCITLVDYQIWLECYRAFLNSPAALAPIPSDAGDMNADGVINGLDLAGFIRTMVDPGSVQFRDFFVVDLDGNRIVDQADVSAMVDLLLGQASSGEQ